MQGSVVYVVLCNVVVDVAVYLSFCRSASLKRKLSCETSSVSQLGNTKTQQFYETSSVFELGSSNPARLP